MGTAPITKMVVDLPLVFWDSGLGEKFFEADQRNREFTEICAVRFPRAGGSRFQM